jgi:DNA-binding response OmpR family regulator
MKGRGMKKILIIDDDSDLREAMKIVLEKNFEIEEAGGKEESYEILKRSTPHLIILDVMMETTSSGFELARELKQDERLRAVKILMLTSVDSITNVDFKSEAGHSDWLPVDDYMNKPIEPKLLLEKVNNLIA